jgi:hypothetical protein
MKKNILTEKDLEGYPIRDLLEGWFFRTTEISPNVYRVEGIDTQGRSVSCVGTEMELDQLIKRCVRDAQEISGITRNNSKN